MKVLFSIIATFLVALPAAAQQQDVVITRPGERTVITTPTKDVPVQGGGYFEYFSSAEKDGLTSGQTTFLPGSRMNWHAHPKGQMLIITYGKGYIQVEGQPKHLLTAGDVVFVPAGKMHWHGAAPDSPFTQIEVTLPDSDGTVYKEGRIITDAEYGR